MFSFPSLPQQWEKRLVRYLLHRLDLLEERTLGDLSNLEGSLGKNSVFTVKDVGIKVEVSFRETPRSSCGADPWVAITQPD
jgi:autophagy-related protein 2